MKIDEKVITRLEQLIQGGNNLLKTRKQGYNSAGGFNIPYDYVDEELSNQWGISCLNILSKVFVETSDYYKRFSDLFRELSEGNSSATLKCLGVIKAAKDDYENGFLFDTRTLIEAEVFDEFLEQAEELFKKGYYQASAVIAGCVLEDGLRKLCDRNSIALPAKATIDPMNVELAKAGIYTKLVQKKITHLADLRNKAAHGEWSEFTERDVEDVIRDVRRFMKDYFS